VFIIIVWFKRKRMKRITFVVLFCLISICTFAQSSDGKSSQNTLDKSQYMAISNEALEHWRKSRIQGWIATGCMLASGSTLGVAEEPTNLIGSLAFFLVGIGYAASSRRNFHLIRETLEEGQSGRRYSLNQKGVSKHNEDFKLNDEMYLKKIQKLKSKDELTSNDLVKLQKYISLLSDSAREQYLETNKQ